MGTPWVSFNGKDCYGCKHLNERGYCELTACIIPCTVRATIPEVKTKTNGDNFRAMTDEELAEWLACICDCTSTCMAMKPCCSKSEKDCVQAWKEWLRQECAE